MPRLPDLLEAAGWRRIRSGEPESFEGYSLTWYRDGARMAIVSEMLEACDGKAYRYHSDGTDLTLARLEVAPACRREGLARKALSELSCYMDLLGLSLYLEPLPMEKKTTLTRDHLRAFYAQFGFVPTDDSRRVMVRRPASAQPPATA